MISNALKKTTRLVSATRKKGFPLPEAKVTELKELLTMVSKTKAVKQDPSLNEALQRTLGSIDRYNRVMDNEDRERLGKEFADVKTALQKDIYKNIKAYNKKTAK